MSFDEPRLRMGENIDSGNIDFLKEGYDRIVVPSDLHDNSTVRLNGSPFMSMALRFMPEVLLDQMVQEYEGTEFGNYLGGEQKRKAAEKEMKIYKKA